MKASNLARARELLRELDQVLADGADERDVSEDDVVDIIGDLSRAELARVVARAAAQPKGRRRRVPKRRRTAA